MLATMTFSIEFLLCVIIGLVIGYVIFAGDTYSHVTTNPCCAFLEDEANERNESPDDASGGQETEQESECCQNKQDSSEQSVAKNEASEVRCGSEEDIEV
jgi:hypothetical protein